MYFEVRQRMAEKLLRVTREYQPDLVVGFDPFDLVAEIDHLDHQVAGEIVRWVAGMAGVEGVGSGRVQKNRPKLWLWQNSGVEVKWARERERYVQKYYKSQAGSDWGRIFALVGEDYLIIR